MIQRASSFSSSKSSCLPPPSSVSPDHEATVGRGVGKSPTIIKTTEEPAPPAALTTLLPPSPTLAPGSRLASTVAVAATVPGRLGSLLSSSNSLSQRPSRSWRPSRIRGYVCCNDTCPPPAPGARLLSTVLFAEMVHGRLRSVQTCHVHSEVVVDLNDFLYRFPSPILRTTQRSLTHQIVLWHAL